MCEQPIARDIARRIETRKREQYEATLKLARAETAAAEERRIEAARNEARQAAEAAMLARLTESQARVEQAEQARLASEQQIGALRAEQATALAQRVQEIQASLQNERDAAVLAEKAKVLKLQSELADMQRKLEGKSAHELGENSEIDLFEQLKAAFEGDRIRRVGKGVNGADVIHEVVNNGRVCGKIIYDAKNRNAWQNEFVAKLRADKLAESADHAILSSNKFPKGAKNIHHQDGVIVASPTQVIAVVEILRSLTIRMHGLRVSAEEREKKSVEIYAFITSEHCRQLLDLVDIQTGKMLELETKEMEAHRRIWDQRGKLISGGKEGERRSHVRDRSHHRHGGPVGPQRARRRCERSACEQDGFSARRVHVRRDAVALRIEIRNLRPRDVGGRVLGAARLALEVGALLDRQRLVEDIALDVARGLQQHLAAADRAHHVAAYNDLLGDDAAGDAGPLADNDVGAVDVALHLAVDLYLAAGDEVAHDGEIRADDGRRAALAEPAAKGGARRARLRRVEGEARRCGGLSIRRLGCSPILVGFLETRQHTRPPPRSTPSDRADPTSSPIRDLVTARTFVSAPAGRSPTRNTGPDRSRSERGIASFPADLRRLLWRLQDHTGGRSIGP